MAETNSSLSLGMQRIRQLIMMAMMSLWHCNVMKLLQRCNAIARAAQNESEKVISTDVTKVHIALQRVVAANWLWLSEKISGAASMLDLHVILSELC